MCTNLLIHVHLGIWWKFNVNTFRFLAADEHYLRRCDRRRRCRWPLHARTWLHVYTRDEKFSSSWPLCALLIYVKVKASRLVCVESPCSILLCNRSRSAIVVSISSKFNKFSRQASYSLSVHTTQQCVDAQRNEPKCFARILVAVAAFVSRMPCALCLSFHRINWNNRNELPKYDRRVCKQQFGVTQCHQHRTTRRQPNKDGDFMADGQQHVTE